MKGGPAPYVRGKAHPPSRRRVRRADARGTDRGATGRTPRSRRRLRADLRCRCGLRGQPHGPDPGLEGRQLLTCGAGRRRGTVAACAMFLAACLSSEPRDILFQAQQPGGTEDLYALRPRDVAIRRILRADTFSSRSLAAWSPDGRAIAFTREFGDTAQLYVLDSLSGMPRRIADGSMGFIAFADWSPDGTRL